MNFQSHHTRIFTARPKAFLAALSSASVTCMLFFVHTKLPATAHTRQALECLFDFACASFSTRSAWIFLLRLVDTCSSFPFGSRVFPLPRPCWFSLTASIPLFWIPWTLHILISQHSACPHLRSWWFLFQEVARKMHTVFTLRHHYIREDFTCQYSQVCIIFKQFPVFILVLVRLKE